MTIFIVGMAMFVIGTILSSVGWSMHKRTIKALPKPFLDWLLGVIRQSFPLLTGPESTTGERIAAFGTILSALGIVVAVVGLLQWKA